jgi:Plasmid pRiA4b ORF-3-like protein
MAKKNSGVNIYKFRVVIDTEEDVFRDIEIDTLSTFESLHNAILDAFDFEGGEMASFYMSNESWEKGLEIPLMEMDARESGKAGMSMKNTKLEDLVSKPGEKVLYVYDFLRMWCFYIELVEIKKDKPSTIYPRVAMAFGDAPSQDSKEMDLYGEEFSEDEFDELNDNDEGGEAEDADEFGSSEEYFDEDEFGGSYRTGDDF